MVTISGRDTKCEAAKQELLSMVPVSKVINVPIEMHRGLIGRGGETVSLLIPIFVITLVIFESHIRLGSQDDARF